jgi:hypothetical protein
MERGNMNRPNKWNRHQTIWNARARGPGAQGAGSRPHPFKRKPPSANSPNLERILLFLSYVHFLATLITTLLFIELVISGGPLAHDTGFISRASLPIAFLGGLNIPFLWRSQVPLPGP